MTDHVTADRDVDAGSAPEGRQLKVQDLPV
jgi:hypothetical protein